MVLWNFILIQERNRQWQICRRWKRWTWIRIQKSEKQLWAFIKSWGHKIALTKRTNFALKLRFPVNIFNFFQILAQGARIGLLWHSLARIRISLLWANSYDNVSIIQICLSINSREFLYHCKDSRGVIPLILRNFHFNRWLTLLFIVT